ncbi:MAG: S8 family serine peptidase [Acidimicrobiia bacterium]
MRAIASLRRGLLAGLVPLTTLGWAASPALAVSPAPPSGAGTYVAVTRDGSGQVQVERFGAGSSRQLSAEIASLDVTGDVLAVERDRTVSVLGSIGPDPVRAEQWPLDRVAYEATWPAGDGRGVVVAVVDSGVDAGHEDLAGAVLPGWDAITDSPGGGVDPVGHGTHVAGIIAARAGNGRGTRGAAPGALILPVRVLRPTGSGSLSDVVEGIVWAVDHGADIINLSLGGEGGGPTYRSVLAYARERGVVVVAAAGNSAEKGNPVMYPGADPDVITVASVDPADVRAPSSGVGPWVDIAAPGVMVAAPCPVPATMCPRSSLPAGYAYLSGTSTATPHVSAAAALLLSARPDLSPAAVQSLLTGTADDLGPAGLDSEYGAGLVDPGEALGRLDATVPAPTTPVPAPGGDAGTGGYWVIGGDGRVAPLGSAPELGGVSAPTAPIVAAAATPTGGGYWLAGARGEVFAFGDAPVLGSLGGQGLNAAIVGMAATATGRGYWLLGADGGVFSFGDAAFLGSTGGLRLNRPVVDMAPTPSGHGYWLVATDGGVFSFGDAAFFGSTGGVRLNRPITSLAAAEGGGYWLVASDGGIFAFGAASFLGSLPGLGLPGLPEGRRIRTTATGDGYYILGADGGVFAFGAAPPHGSPGGLAAVDLLVAR